MQACRVLIVEDELLVAADIEASLQRDGLEVVGIAEEYEQAVALAEREMPDLVLMDIQLRSRRNGIDAATVIRDRWQIPVIFLTANANEQSLARARAAGPYGFLTKPFRTEELTETVRIALEQRHFTQELFSRHHWLNAVLGTLTDAVVATDAQGNVRFINAAAEQMTGWNPVDAHGKVIEEVFPLTNLDGTEVLVCPARQALTQNGSTANERFLLQTRSGSVLPVELSAAAILEGGGICGAVTVNIDITSVLEQERRREVERDRLEEQTQSVREALGETRAELRALAANLIRTQEEERRRIARELHDDLGQQSALVGMLIERIGAELPADNGSLAELRNAAAKLSGGLREVSHQLHPSVLEYLGLVAALEELIEQERALEREIGYTARGVPHVLAPDVSTTLYRIAQEGLRNTAKHAPGAPVHVSLQHENGGLTLKIQDAGPGVSPIQIRGRSGLGLLSMQERVRLVGGSLEVTTVNSGGTLLMAHVPLGE